MYLFVILCDSTLLGILGTRCHSIQVDVLLVEQELLTIPGDLSSPAVFQWGSWCLLLVFCVDLVGIVFFSFGHCIDCISSIYGSWLPIWYIRTFIFIRQYANIFTTFIYFHFPDLLGINVEFCFSETLLMHVDLVGLPICMNVLCSNEGRLGHFMEYELCTGLG